MSRELVKTPSKSGFSVTKDESTWALVAHALTFVEGGLIGPLVLYVVKKDESEFVAFHALQSLYFGLLFVGLSVMSCGILAIPGVFFYLGYEILATIRAAEGQWYELPIVGAWARRVHPGTAV